MQLINRNHVPLSIDCWQWDQSRSLTEVELRVGEDKRLFDNSHALCVFQWLRNFYCAIFHWIWHFISGWYFDRTNDQYEIHYTSRKVLKRRWFCKCIPKEIENNCRCKMPLCTFFCGKEKEDKLELVAETSWELSEFMNEKFETKNRLITHLYLSLSVTTRVIYATMAKFFLLNCSSSGNLLDTISLHSIIAWITYRTRAGKSKVFD